MSDSRQTIGLCMIVRNEAPVIERCLASVRDLIDTWVICDTGSSDGTPGLIRAALAGIPGRLESTPWVDFGHNRSELMELALGSADYLLLLDADMTVVQQAPLPALTADAYLLRETGPLDYAVHRVVRGDRRWWFEGSTHEHIATNGRFTAAPLPALAIEHHADGSSRQDKLLRDVGLLKRDLAADPANPRPVFYLAQTFRELGKPDLAIEYYRRRIDMGGWAEEVFYANLQEGLVRAESDFAAAVPVLLEAWQRRPTRAEPLYELARRYRERGDHELAELFAARGLAIAYPEDVLFVHRPIYDWGLALEHALALDALGRTDEARDGLRAILGTEGLPPELRLSVGRSLRELGKRIAQAGTVRTPQAHRLAAVAPGLRMGEIKLDVQPPWPSFNPSITADGSGFRMIVRTANYEIEKGVLHPDGVLRNINYLVGLDAGLAVTSIEPLVDRAAGLQRFPAQVQGFEDCRLIRIGDRWLASATVSDLNPLDRREVALLALDGPTITEARALAGPQPGRHEKNWMPFELDGALHFVYSCAPTVVFRCDPTTGALEQVAAHPAPEFARGFRGGSQGLPVDGGHLFVVHEVDRSGPALRYLHRFVLLDTQLALAAASEPFSFTSDTVEFCAGIAQAGDDIVLSFGVSDAAAGLAVLPLAEALALIEPIDTPGPLV